MKNLIIAIALLLGASTYAQQEKEIHFDDLKNLYMVKTNCDNWHHVTEDGIIHGPFKHTFGNVVIEGSMKNGKRHGTLIKYVEGRKEVVIEYDNGKAVTYTTIL